MYQMVSYLMWEDQQCNVNRSAAAIALLVKAHRDDSRVGSIHKCSDIFALYAV
jgi:hypothetical protein